jgi:hypothetical protein
MMTGNPKIDIRIGLGWAGLNEANEDLEIREERALMKRHLTSGTFRRACYFLLSSRLFLIFTL